MSTSDLLRVAQSYAFDAREAEIEIDEYVPLRFRTSRDALGVGFVRLGNYRTTLVEIGVEPLAQTVRGFTLTSISGLSHWPSFNLIERAEGLPVLSTTFEGGEVVSLPHDFEVAIRDSELVVFWEPLGSCTGFTVAPTTFLVTDGQLVGVHFTQLTQTQIELIKSRVGK